MIREQTQPFHGGDRLSACAGKTFEPNELMDFSANIMPFGLSHSVREAVVAALDQCCNYPDPYQRELRQALAERHRLTKDQIVCGNGAADVLYRTLQVLKPRRVYLPVPTFLQYEKACLEQKAEVIHYPLSADQDFMVTEALVDWLKAQKKTSDRDLLILCNPNNPTGLLIEPSVMERIISCCQEQNLQLLLDESFMDFVDQPQHYSQIQRLKSIPDDSLLILNSLTKFHAIPGLRLGYLCTHPSLAASIQTVGQPWPVSILAEKAGLAALREQQLESETIMATRQGWLKKERDRLGHALSDKGWQVWPSRANFLLFRAMNTFDLTEKLLKHKILIRSCANYPGLDHDYYRIAVKTEAENQMFIDALKQVTLEKDTLT